MEVLNGKLVVVRSTRNRFNFFLLLFLPMNCDYLCLKYFLGWVLDQTILFVINFHLKKVKKKIGFKY